MRKRNREIGWAEISASQIDVDGESCIMALVRDVSRIVEAEEKIRSLVFYDALTNLPNRRLLEDRFHQLSAHAMRHGGKIGLLYIDLDEFKPINDELGHATGDLVLSTIAARLREVVRTTDTAARIGGDEFIVVLSELQGREDALRIAEMIRCVIANPITTPQGNQLTASASIGTAIYPDDAEDLRKLLHCGDEAMYQAKNRGGGKVECYESSHAASGHVATA
jgi:diguanylate cyclase (GGDEF)-like protein